jgi:hypothetical protein
MEALAKTYPQHKSIIEKYTRPISRTWLLLQVHTSNSSSIQKLLAIIAKPLSLLY